MIEPKKVIEEFAELFNIRTRDEFIARKHLGIELEIENVKFLLHVGVDVRVTPHIVSYVTLNLQTDNRAEFFSAARKLNSRFGIGVLIEDSMNIYNANILSVEYDKDSANTVKFILRDDVRSYVKRYTVELTIEMEAS